MGARRTAYDASLGLVHCAAADAHSIAMAHAPARFSPHTLLVGARERGCFTCEHFQGRFWGENVVCQQDVRPRVIGIARMGCAFWMRAIGSDD